MSRRIVLTSGMRAASARRAAARVVRFSTACPRCHAPTGLPTDAAEGVLVTHLGCRTELKVVELCDDTRELMTRDFAEGGAS